MKRVLKITDVKNLHTTNDYSKFEFLEENRPIIPSKIKSLKRSISKIGFLGTLIVVKFNGKLYIADGQHRLVALQMLDLPVVYEIVEVKTKKELVELIATLNSTATAWKLTDYVHAWKVSGNIHYTKLYSMFVRYNFAIVETAAVLANSGHTQLVGKIKRGDFTVQLNEITAIKILNYAESLLSFLPDLTRFQISKFVRAFVRYYRFIGESYDHESAIKKVKDNIECLRLFMEDKDFFEFFEK